MDHNICFKCGGTLRNDNGIIVCENCGSPLSQNISSEEITLLTTACQKLRLADFSEAEAEFEDIIRRHPQCAQAYWGRLLAKYGIKYETDYNGKLIPTCYAASIESVLETSDYRNALLYADSKNKEIYHEDAQYIERVRKKWLEKASKQKPYDIFISYKDSDRENGVERTQDSFEAESLYYHLKEEGYRVFFSRVSLVDNMGEKYEPYIYGALSTAKIMIVYGTKPEYIQATWVKNEWTRYLKRIRAGEKKEGSLVVAYKDFAPQELPGTLSSLQCLNMTDPYFYPSLLNQIKKILEQRAPAEPVFQQEEKDVLCNHTSTFTVPGRPATCTETGLTEGVYCEDCGATLKNPTFIPAAGHRFGEWRIAKKATCTEDGEHERVCHCGERETRKIPSRGGHIISDEWETVTEAAPAKTGLKIKKCMVCGETIEKETIPALPSVNYSKGLQYAVNEDGKTCTVTGQGECKDQDIVIPDKINGYRVTGIVGGILTSGFSEDIASVTIPNSVTSIGDSAFSGCWSLASVTIPNSVTFIGRSAFWGCTSLASVSIPNSVTSIGYSAFSGCMSLASVTIPNSVTNIDGGTFAGVGEIKVSHDHPAYTSIDGNLYSKDKKTLIHYAANHKETAFVIPNSVTSIGEGAFESCTSLASVTIPSSVTSIGDNAFSWCESLASVTIPNSVTSIGEEAFWNCESLASVTIPNSVTSIGDKAFLGCTSLASVTIPNSVTSIGRSAFWGCKSLASVTIPNSVTSIGWRAFYGCTSLSDFYFYGKREQWARIQLGNGWNGDSAIREIQFGSPHLAYTINSDGKTCTVTGQGECKDKDILIPEKIDGYRVTGIVGGIIKKYTSGFSKDIASVTIPSSVTSIGEEAFSWCESLASVTIPSSVTSIGYAAFGGCSSLASVTIPSSVTSIGNGAFKYCRSLASVTIPNSVTSIGGGAFVGVGEIKVSDDHPTYTSINGNLYSKNKKTLIHYAANHKETSFTIPNSVTSIGKLAFYGCESLASVTIPNSVTSIDFGAFYGCESLASVTIPNSVTSIGDDAFWGCTSLASVTIPNSVTSIGDWAFSGCMSLASVTIPNSVTSIGRSAFSHCTSLSDFYFYGKREQWARIQLGNGWNGDSAIREIQFGSPHLAYTINSDGKTCTVTGQGECKDKDILIPEEINGYRVTGIVGGIIKKYNSGFSKDIASVTIPNSVTSIGEYAFSWCESLASVTIPSSVTSIGEEAFRGTNLKNIRYDGTKSQWKQISLGKGWRKDSAIRSVTCTKEGFLNNKIKF